MARLAVRFFENRLFEEVIIPRAPLPPGAPLGLGTLPVHEDTICNSKGMLLNSRFQSIPNVTMDKTQVRLATDGIFTNGLATCAAICVYGWKTSFDWMHVNTKTAPCMIALSHASSSWASTLDACVTELQAHKYWFFRTCIIGGMVGGYTEELDECYRFDAELGKADMGGLECVVAPLLDNQGGASAVYASADGIAFHIYDETPDPGMDEDDLEEEPMESQPSDLRLPRIDPTRVNLGSPPLGPFPCFKCGRPAMTERRLCLICENLYR